MFTKAIVRKPGRSLIQGLTTANLGIPDYDRAVNQHKVYVSTLKECGLSVIELTADENYPDSTFVEDTALLTPHCAIITNPGAPSRQGEIIEMKPVIQKYYSELEEVFSPGTVDGGDIMMVGSHYYIGLSERTNVHGAEQLVRILNKYDLSGSLIRLENMLHLKTGLAYLENNNLVARSDFVLNQEFKKFSIIEIPKEEAYAANCLWLNDRVLVPMNHPISSQKITAAGYTVIEVNMSEFQKLDGGLSCLSLRF